MSQKDIYLSVIIPSYKSAEVLDKNISFLLDFLKQKEFTYEIIVVDDGSSDDGKTRSVTDKWGLKFLENPVNMGKGAALRNGMINAKGRFRIFTDADIPYDNKAIDLVLNYLDFKEFDMVTGDRTLKASSYFSEVSNTRSFGSKIFSFLVGRFIAGGQYDTQCGIKGFRDNVADDLFSRSTLNGFAIDVELFYIAFKRNYDVKCIPVTLRSVDGSSVSVVKHGIMMLMDLPKILINYYTGKYNKEE